MKTLYWANFFKLKINPDPLSKIPKKTEAALFSFYLWDWVEDLSLSVFLASEIITNNTVVSTAAPRLVLCPLLLHFAPFARYYSRELWPPKAILGVSQKSWKRHAHREPLQTLRYVHAALGVKLFCSHRGITLTVRKFRRLVVQSPLWTARKWWAVPCEPSSRSKIRSAPVNVALLVPTFRRE